MRRPLSLSLILLCMGLLVGCSPEQETTKEPASQEDHRPASVAEGVAGLQKARDTIKAAFEAGTPHDCDMALHEAANIVSSLEEVAKEEGLSTEAVETVKTSCKELYGHLSTIHDGFHGGGELDNDSYGKVAEGIDAAITSLSELTN